MNHQNIYYKLDKVETIQSLWFCTIKYMSYLYPSKKSVFLVILVLRALLFQKQKFILEYIFLHTRAKVKFELHLFYPKNSNNDITWMFEHTNLS